MTHTLRSSRRSLRSDWGFRIPLACAVALLAGTCASSSLSAGAAATFAQDSVASASIERLSPALDAVIAFYRASSRLQVVDGEGEIGEVGVRLARAATAVGLHA